MRLVAILAVLGACGNDCPSGWTPLFDRAQLTRPLLSIGGKDRDVWLVGGPVGTPGLTTAIEHWDGAVWSAIPRAGTETLWWVWAAPDGTVWMVGEKGLVLRWRAGALETLPSGTDVTLFGVWGSSADDVWIVGGTPGAGAGPGNDVALHWNGTRFDGTPGPPAKGDAFFKVWGAAANDVWIVGEAGTAWRRTDAGWQDHAAELATLDSVITVHGCSATDVWAVAGQGIYRFDGTRWAPAAGVQVSSGANGVACGARGALVVGNGGLKLRWDRAAGRWSDDTLQEPYYSDFHGAWIGPDGSLWAVGGNYNAPASAPREGMAAFQGCPVPR
jgi:hypothetical protein